METYRKHKSALLQWRKRRQDAIAGDITKLSSVDDSSLRTDQEVAFASVYPYGIDEFDRMLGRLDIDTRHTPLRTVTRVDLYLKCVTCAHRDLCQDWLSKKSDSGGYRQFCPNSWMFDRLRSVNRWRRTCKVAAA